MPEPEVGGEGVGVAGALFGAALAVLFGGGSQLVVVEPGAGEVRLVAGRVVVGVLEVLAYDVEHEDWVDDPNGGGEVAAALVDVGVAAGAGAVAQRCVDADLERLALGAGGQRVELALELGELAAEHAGGLLLRRRCEVGAGLLDLVGGVEQRAVVDADRVRVLVLDDGAVHEGAEVAQRLFVQVGGGDALGDGERELGRDLVHVGELVGHGDRQLVAAGAFGHAAADRVGQSELAEQVVRSSGADAEVGADGGDAVFVGQAGARLPAVAELLLLVGEGELLAAVGLCLDAPDLVVGWLVVEQQHDQAPDGRQVLIAVGAGEAFAGLGGEQAALAVVDHRAGGGGIRAAADARHELAGAHEHRGQARDPLGGDHAPRVRGEFEPVQRHAFDGPLGLLGRDGCDIE